MKSVGLVLLAIAAVAAGAGVTAVVAKQQFGDEVGALAARFGVKVDGKGDALATLDALVPGESERLKKAAAVTAVSGAVVAVAAYALLREVLA